MQRFFPYLTLSVALILALIAAYYSVFGLSKLFSSQATAVIIMAAALEISKLVTATYLHRYWNNIIFTIKTYLISALIILMCITSLGIYGFLVSAYQETAYNVQEVDQKIDLQTNKKNRFESQLKTISVEKQSLNKNITELTSGLSNNKIQRKNRNGDIITTTSGSTRRALEKQLDKSIKRRDVLAVKEYALTDSISNIDLKILNLQTNSEAVAEIGPLKYVAKITGQEIDRVVNWFILLFIIVFDPLAVILLVSAQHAFKKNKPKKNIYGESKNYFELRNQNINKIIKQRNIVDNIKQQLIKEVREEIQKDKIQQKQEIIETLESEKELDPEPIEEVKQTPRPPDTPPKSM
tara:strand:+ start:452 stop:1507 length:1056 start_codon:yes stop_codon:yes gene_type:complete